MAEDLLSSGLEPSDMRARLLDSSERAMTMVPHSTEGYVIPYFKLYGRPEPFYRVKLFDFLPKYKQPKDTQSYVYFPPNFFDRAKTSPYVIITEGEKKAASATKLGFPTCALGGVDAWRTRSIVLPVDSELSKSKTKLQAKLPSNTNADEDVSGLAVGMQDLIDFLLKHKKHLIICYDSDLDVGIKPSVQRAAATLAFELRFRGIPFSHLRQIILPPIDIEIKEDAAEAKIGLDDYLIKAGAEKFDELVKHCLAKRSAFPRHPAIRDLINRRLQKMNPTRRDIQQLSIAILSDLDANGIRLRSSSEEQSYYFDFLDRKLLKTTFTARGDDVSETLFGQFLYRRYGISGADKRLVVWLAAQFTGEDPVEDVDPYRVIARAANKDDSVNYQISDSQYCRVTKDGIEIFDNGENGILFESEQVAAVDSEKFLRACTKPGVQDAPLTNQWYSVLGDVRLRDQNSQRRITSLLYYLSPWLYRWRGMQLPVEMVLGESGSGKSTLFELRLSILTGDVKLRNSPTDLKDWHASIANTGGLHVTDNVQLVDRSLRQRLSDEICRLVTEPEPHIEMRKYYTEADLKRIPIKSVFALTAIQQPFQNADLLQRSIILDLDKSTALEGGRDTIMYDSEWRNNKLQAFGGREGWLAHHMLVLQRFFQLVDKKWDPTYKAKHRLINFEQSLRLMAEVFGEEHDWIPNYLVQVVDKSLAESDWTFEGIKTFCEQYSKIASKDHLFKAQDIVEWAMGQEDFEKCEMLTNARRLGRYLQAHKALIASSVGFVESGMRNNRQVYKIARPSKS